MTDFNNQSLFRIPSFSKGAARTVSILGDLDEYQLSDTESEADSKALGSDWQAVSKDMMSGINEYARTSQKSNS